MTAPTPSMTIWQAKTIRDIEWLASVARERRSTARFWLRDAAGSTDYTRPERAMEYARDMMKESRRLTRLAWKEATDLLASAPHLYQAVARATKTLRQRWLCA